MRLRVVRGIRFLKQSERNVVQRKEKPPAGYTCLGARPNLANAICIYLLQVFPHSQIQVIPDSICCLKLRSIFYTLFQHYRKILLAYGGFSLPRGQLLLSTTQRYPPLDSSKI